MFYTHLLKFENYLVDQRESSGNARTPNWSILSHIYAVQFFGENAKNNNTVGALTFGVDTSHLRDL